MSQGWVPICPGEGSRLSQGRFLFVLDTVLPKMFMFIGFFLGRPTPAQATPPGTMQKDPQGVGEEGGTEGGRVGRGRKGCGWTLLCAYHERRHIELPSSLVPDDLCCSHEFWAPRFPKSTTICCFCPASEENTERMPQKPYTLAIPSAFLNSNLTYVM